MSSLNSRDKIHSRGARSKKKEQKPSKLKYPLLLIGLIGMICSLVWFIVLILEIIDHASGMSYAEVHGYSDFLTRSLDYYLISFMTCLVLILIFTWMYKSARKKF